MQTDTTFVASLSFLFLMLISDFATVNSTAKHGRPFPLSALFALLMWFDFGVQVH